MRFVHNRHLLLVYVALGLLLPLLASQPASAQQGGDSYSHSTPSGNRILCVPPQTLSDAGRARWYQENVLTGRIQCRGAYNPCYNPNAPAWCPSRAAAAVPKQGSGIDTQGPDNEGPFVKGFLDGVSQCIWSGCTDPKQIAMIGVAFYAARFGQAARLAGVLNAVGRGASVASLVSLINSGEQITSDDPYAMGFAEGKKFCSWESSWLGISMPSFRGGEPPAGGSSSVSMPGGLQDYVWAKRGYATCYARKANFNVSDVLRDLTWLKTLNRSGCKTNCGNCALTVAYALSGKGVLEAPPMCIAGTTPDTLETIFGGKFDYPKNGLTGIDHAIASAGNGAAGIVAIGDDTSGHVFNIVNDNGSVRLLDGQAGRELNWQEVVQWIRQKNWTKFGLLMTN